MNSINVEFITAVIVVLVIVLAWRCAQPAHERYTSSVPVHEVTRAVDNQLARAVVLESTGALLANSIRVYRYTYKTGYDFACDECEVAFQAGEWQYTSYAVGPASEPLALRFYRLDTTLEAYMNVDVDITDLAASVRAAVPDNTYADLFDGTSDVFMELMRFFDANQRANINK